MLDSLEEAIAQGALRVQFGDREVIYRSIDEMMKVRDLIRRKLGLVDTSEGNRVYPSHSKGFYSDDQT
jgi:hypothetical protein